ncbi:hypothetical protein HAX54_008993, partial [Datura stramonium]|nr:hypothetical protein [Datura stramonium]
MENVRQFSGASVELECNLSNNGRVLGSPVFSLYELAPLRMSLEELSRCSLYWLLLSQPSWLSTC